MAETAEAKEDDVLDDMVIGGSADFKVGQKYPTPAPANGDRVFYESLLEQRPDSEMAQDWCLAYGVLPHGEAEKLYKTVCQRKGVKPSPMVNKKAPPPGKSSSSSSSSSAAPGRARKEKVLVEGDMADDAAGSGMAWEGGGAVGGL